MAVENHVDPHLEIAHVLFVDIVGYSKRLINEQSALIKKLNQLVRGTEQFQKADAASKLISIPTGDGMALAFFTTPDAPVRCAIELAIADRDDPKIELRMGIHSGPVDQVADVNQRTNVAGDGINMAQRVMDCGDAGHIILSQRVAADLTQYARWQEMIHDLGDVEVKHGVKIHIASLFGDGFGNATLPGKLATYREQQTAEAKRHRSQSATRKRLIATVLVVTAVAAIAGGIVAYRASRRLGAAELAKNAAAAIPAKSVAVLPFENLSADPNNTFFVNGVQDEILTRAGKIASLKVIARTSTRQYEPKPANLAEVGKQLGVANVLEGSVQKIADKVRVNVQLIRTAANEQLWGETYDRQLTDVFAVESEIASRIATSLQATLSPEEKARVNAIPTTNPEAYDLYVQGRESMYAHIDTPEANLKRKQGFERAIAIDPTFALGYTALSEAYSFDALDDGVTPDKKMKARSYADEAVRLQPDLGEAHVALGSYYYRVERNYDEAMKEYSTALKSEPNDAELLRDIAMLERRRGNWHAAIDIMQRAVTLDPRSMLVIEALTDLYMAIHQLAAAEDTKRREMAVAKTIPHASQLNAAWLLCGIQWMRTGRTDQFHAVLEQSNDKFDEWERVWTKADLGRVERNPDAVIEALRDFDRPDTQWMLTHAFLAKGDTNAARGMVQKELPALEDAVKKSPDESKYHSQLGMRYAVLGRKEDAMREGRRAVELLPETRDAVDGAKLIGNLAYIYAHVGETDEAIKLVERMVNTAPWFNDEEFWQSCRGMQVCWEWDPLRRDPRFQKLVEGEPPKVTFK